ncbi:hemagglutinin repeat-containing protein [Ramlibacter sp. AN1015]|uniref:hemagglutinin repeat-containing protein n=1 Tax=Ramlibacter sp. AN1015 TaxID=3133428 RepID=UPI0030BEB94F
MDIRAAVDSHAVDQQSAVHGRGYERAAQSHQSLSDGTVRAGGNVTVVASEDLTARGAKITSDRGETSLVAGRDVKLEALTTEHTSERESLARRRGFLSSRTDEREERSTQRLAEGTLVAGESVTIRAGRDALVIGSQVVAQQDAVIAAKRDVRTSGQVPLERRHFRGVGTPIEFLRLCRISQLIRLCKQSSNPTGV